MKSRIGFIDFLKGFACIGVFLSHLLLILPATYTGKIEDSVVSGDYLLGRSPIGFLINGNFYVCLFLMISAYLLSGNILHRESFGLYVAKSLCKRLPRLLLPTLVVNVIGFALSELFSFFCISFKRIFDIGFLEMIKISLFDIWFEGGVQYCGYWMMQDLFYGSCLSIILSFVLTQIPKRNFGRMLIILLFPFLFFVRTYYAAILFGVILAYEEKEIISFFCRKKITRFIMLSAVAFFILFAGYPSAGNVFTGAYGWANWLPTSVRGASHLFHMVAAFLLFIIWFVYREKINALLPQRISSFLSTISFSVYLVHPFINNFFTVPVWKYLRCVISLEAALTVVIICAIPMCIIFSWLFYTLIEKRINLLINKITELAFSRDTPLVR